MPAAIRPTHCGTIRGVPIQTNSRAVNTALFAKRLESGLTQAELAEQIGVSQRVYQYAEAGGIPQPRHIARFSAFYGVSAFDLFYPEMKETI
jgi:transcriptional regulator with XRE-family HTH domain